MSSYFILFFSWTMVTNSPRYCVTHSFAGLRLKLLFRISPVIKTWGRIVILFAHIFLFWREEYSTWILYSTFHTKQESWLNLNCEQHPIGVYIITKRWIWFMSGEHNFKLTYSKHSASLMQTMTFWFWNKYNTSIKELWMHWLQL